MSKILKAHIALFLANLIYAGNYTIAKWVMPAYMKPLAFVFLRASFGFVVFWLVHQFFIKDKVERKDIPLLALCGLFGVALNQMFFFAGLNLTNPINASLILTMVPIIVMTISALVLKERFGKIKIGGVFLGAIGAAIIILNKTAADLSVSGLKGDLLVFLNSTSYAIYLILVRKLMKKYHPITVVKYVFFFGWLFIIPFGISDTLLIEWGTLDTRAWWSVAYVLIFVSVGAYFFNAFALGELSPTVVSSYIYSQPIMASLIAISLAEDQLDFYKILGGSLIFLGVYLVSKPAANKMMSDER